MNTKNETINFNSNIPYYVQLINIIKSKIAAKVWVAGNRIPGEPNLCEEYGVSRTVVRQALLNLELNGYIIRRKGKGTFVADTKINESLVQKLTGFYQDMVGKGLKPVTKVLKMEIIPASEKVARYLEIPAGSDVVEIERLRFIDSTPIHLVTSYVPYNLVPKLANVDLTNRSFYEFLETECGLFIARGRRYIEAVVANETEAKSLNVERGAPLVMLESITFLEDGTPIEYYHALHRGDRTRFEVELVRTREIGDSIEHKGLVIENLPRGGSSWR